MHGVALTDGQKTEILTTSCPKTEILTAIEVFATCDLYIFSYSECLKNFKFN